ncbi:MAG: Maf family nucleotide pyrophosphatase [Flavobacteriales bacterium]
MDAHPPLPALRLILASTSPRRRELLQKLDLPVEITSADVDETPPPGMPPDEVAEHLARKKSGAWPGTLAPDQVLVTADTTVLVDELLLNKPEDEADAHRMLRLLAGRTHRVITGVCLRTAARTHSFADEALVTFRPLDDEEIAYYVKHYRPMDRAGAYGVQDWIGYTGVERINGSFYTVMGLPMHRIYAALREIR